MSKISLSLYAKTLSQECLIYHLSMLGRELASFDKQIILSDIQDLNGNQGYNHIVVHQEGFYQKDKPSFVARTSSCLDILIVENTNITKDELIYWLFKEIAIITD